MKIEIYGYTDIGNRNQNEDSYSCENYGGDRYALVVADGLGGHEGGKEASQIAVRHLAAPWDDTDVLPSEDAIMERLAVANEDIIRSRENEDQMKSTVVALYLSEDNAEWVHIGDSRLYHYHNGELAHYTLDHSVVQISVKLGEITRNQMPGHPDRSKLLRVLGTDELKPEFSGQIRLSPGRHAFLLCSDGLWDYLQEDEIMLDLNKSVTPRQWIDCLRVRALKRMEKDESVDNNTALAAFIEVTR